jgi:hypothetical protein
LGRHVRDSLGWMSGYLAHHHSLLVKYVVKVTHHVSTFMHQPEKEHLGTQKEDVKSLAGDQIEKGINDIVQGQSVTVLWIDVRE